MIVSCLRVACFPCLSVQLVIKAAIKAKTNPLPAQSKGGLYLVLTSDDIHVQDFCVTACGFHYFTFPSIVGYTLPYAWVENSERMCSGLCAYPFAIPDYARGIVKPLKSPNGKVGVDAMISVIAHDMEEMATDPLINDWYASSDPADPVEIADLCIGKYGGGGGSGYLGEVRRDANGVVFNVYGIRRRFLIQWVWSYVADDCVGP
ncbi:putative protein EXORDIUM [Helianthus annuus]|uniref:Phosphate-induced protein 1 n=1 Tax=Helianthus annuus TaxID=4232 RepID=A0A9K3HWJ4_HELAN|nr:putative protein EXORDIUM [Helianthus annuus]KAJ0513280.1 putative protein EXORDIUM [Helianthus annuus]KAJ0521058.1 putative protein EXORDIUM [Helianthus annuus]KAJ0696281.1 putative protein EXORDIUM [Helianthus annuus]KAJ0878890.1 putative protein EXORDIUM [Helianthus annuus]